MRRPTFWLGIACAVAGTAVVVQLGGAMGLTIRLVRAGEAALEFLLRAIL